MEEYIKNLIFIGENVNVEFKSASNSLPKNLFETVCAFLNTTGGYIILGVSDEKQIIGIDKENIEKYKKEYSSLCNNPNIINPVIISELKEIEIDGKVLLYTQIQESNTIHKYKSKVYIRRYEGDYDITDNFSLIAHIYNHKNKIYDEDKIYPYVSVEEDLRHDLIEKARKLATNNLRKEHPWNNMTDLELLKSAGLYRLDKESGKSGVTLAGVMLFGKDEVILNVNPLCRTDALYRVDDLDRYDDRDFIETNLLDMYDRLISFVTKYTMDRFALNESCTIRISPRNIMIREMIVNTLMHRDITDGHTSRVIVYKDKIVCENPNSFRSMQELTLENYTPFAKNPTLAKFFREIGYADELGSGVKKITESSLLYSGKLPRFEDKEMFRLTIPLLRENKVKETDMVYLINSPNVLFGNVTNVTKNVTNQVLKEVLEKIISNRAITQEQIAIDMNISLRTVKRAICILKQELYIIRVGSSRKGYWQILKRDK